MYRRSPRTPDDDEISFISMQELAPTPIEDDDYLDLASSYTIEPTGTTGTTPTGLSASRQSISSSHYSTSPRSLAFWLARTQKYSSYAFASFLGIHATTASLTPLIFGLDSGNSSLLLARTYYYQSHPYVELFLIPGSLLLHIGSGLGLRAYRHYQQRKRYGGRPPAALAQWRWRNFSSMSLVGWTMVPFVAAHAILLRAVPLLVDGGSHEVTLEYLGHGFSLGPWGWWAWSGFYTVMVGLVSYHVVSGWAKYLGAGQRKRRVTVVTATAVAGAWLSGLFVVVARSGPVRGYLGRHYDRLYNVYFGRVV